MYRAVGRNSALPKQMTIPPSFSYRLELRGRNIFAPLAVTPNVTVIILDHAFAPKNPSMHQVLTKPNYSISVVNQFKKVCMYLKLRRKFAFSICFSKFIHQIRFWATSSLTRPIMNRDRPTASARTGRTITPATQATLVPTTQTITTHRTAVGRPSQADLGD